MKKNTTMKQEPTPAKPIPFRCPENCIMCGAFCRDCDSFDYTQNFCDHHNKPTTGNTWACPDYYSR